MHHELRFNDMRRELAEELKSTCETFSISFDGWSASNHMHILGVIAHWITQDFERRSMVIEFAEMLGGKSGKAMADLIWETIGPDYKKVVETIKDDVITTTTQERVGLNCAEKLFAVCGDNASPNDTFCDHLLEKLLQEHDDDPTANSDLPRCRFHGRLSRTRCVAHIIALIVDAILTALKRGTYKEAIELVAEINDKGGVFSAECCLSLSVYQKIRAFVLWIQSSDERRAEWKKFCAIMIPLDVDTRWNALYLMMTKAREFKANITRFGRSHHEVQHLVPTEEEWSKCEIVERVLLPFYDHTRSVSKDSPSLPETLGIMWGLDDLLDDVAKADGQFGDVGDDIRQAFSTGVAELDKYMAYINDNVMYFAAVVLDP